MTIAPSVLAKYTGDIAFAAGEQPAQTTDAFLGQLQTAADNLDTAGINGAENLETAATLISESMTAPVAEQRMLIARANRLLRNIPDMVDEFRDMV